MSVVEPSSVNLRNLLGVRDENTGYAAAGRRNYSGLTLEDILMREKLHAPVAAASPAPAPSRTLLDIIRNEEPNPGSCSELIAGHNRDRKSWKSLKDKLWFRLGGGGGGGCGGGAGWTSGTSTPASDCSVNCRRSPISGGNSVSARFDRIAAVSDDSTPALTQSNNPVEVGDNNDRGEITRPRTSVRFGMLVPISTEPTRSGNTPAEALPSENSWNNSAKLETGPAESSSVSRTSSGDSPTSAGSDVSERDTTMRSDNTPREATRLEVEQAREATRPESEQGLEPTRRLSVVLELERELSGRESESTRGAAEATAPTPTSVLAPELEGTEAETGARMSLMELLEEAEGQQVGLMVTGQWCVLGDANAVEEENDCGGGGGGGGDNSCCVCMVRRKGAAFIPCGHTFCRLCSRELWVSRGACPLCNSSIQEVLDIF